MQRKLIYRPVINKYECPLGYLVRLAEGNGFRHLGLLLAYAGLGWKNNRAPIRKILEGEFDLKVILRSLGVSNFSSMHSAQALWEKSKTRNIFVKHPKLCPYCIEEDGYCTYSWSFLPVIACTKHSMLLVDTSANYDARLSWYRGSILSIGEDGAVTSGDAKVAQKKVLDISRYFEGLIKRKPSFQGVSPVLVGMNLHEAWSLIYFIAHYHLRLKGDRFQPLQYTNMELASVLSDVWTLLKKWPDSFYQMLSQYIDAPMSKRGSAGINKHFRDISEQLHRDGNNKGIQRIKAEFDRYIEAYWPGALNTQNYSRINVSLDSRSIITKKEAAHILGSRLERIDKLVQQGRITPVVFKGKAQFQRGQVEALAHKMSSNWTMAETCDVLEVTRYQLKQLLDAGVIPVLQKPDSLNRDWIVDKQGCLALISVLRGNARKSEPPQGAKSLAGIQRQGYSIVQLVLAMQSGELQYSSVSEVDGASSLKQFTSICITKRL